MSSPDRQSTSASRKRAKVLFVCMGNACRSPMAESIARRDAADVIDPCSAGLAPLGQIPELTRRTLLHNGCSIENLCSTSITRDVWESADLVINMSGIEKDRAFVDQRKVEDWDVQDPYGTDPALYQTIYEDICRRVELLAQRLRNSGSNQMRRSPDRTADSTRGST